MKTKTFYLYYFDGRKKTIQGIDIKSAMKKHGIERTTETLNSIDFYAEEDEWLYINGNWSHENFVYKD